MVEVCYNMVFSSFSESVLYHINMPPMRMLTSNIALDHQKRKKGKLRQDTMQETISFKHKYHSP